jgi:CheY-like chemotaxis protein
MSKNLKTTELELARREIDRLREQLRKMRTDKALAREKANEKLHQLARDFRVPLASVLGFSDILSTTTISHSAELNHIAKAGHQLMELIEQMECPIDPETEDPVDLAHESNNSTPISRSLLHIEDNETNFRLVECILEDRPDINLIWAASGASGVALALEQNPKLILLDLNLPDIHGSEVLALLKENPATGSIPVVVLSADVTPSRIERMLEAGARDYLTKPFDIKRLLCVVDDALQPAGPHVVAA